MNPSKPETGKEPKVLRHVVFPGYKTGEESGDIL
jgi:hypothetical protein